MGWQSQFGLDLMYPDLSAKVTTKIHDTKISTDKNGLKRMFHTGDAVNVMNFQGRPKWLYEIFNFLSAVRGWLPMEKTSGSYSHEYSNKICREKLRSI